MSKMLAAELTAFPDGNGDDDVGPGDVLAEITDTMATGVIEVAFDFDAPKRGKHRLYLRLPLGEVVRLAITEEPTP